MMGGACEMQRHSCWAVDEEKVQLGIRPMHSLSSPHSNQPPAQLEWPEGSLNMSRNKATEYTPVMHVKGSLMAPLCVHKCVYKILQPSYLEYGRFKNKLTELCMHRVCPLPLISYRVYWERVYMTGWSKHWNAVLRNLGRGHHICWDLWMWLYL